MLEKWNELPDFMRIPEVRTYYDILEKKRTQLFIKRIFDCLFAILLLFVLCFPMIIIAIWIKLDSKGPVLYRQIRVTKNGKKFRIHKFRTMIVNADKIGTGITVDGDDRITHVGKKLRRARLDELPQLFDVLKGDMTFVGTRPESVKYVKRYSKEYYATLLLPAGITSEASINFKDEDLLLKDVENVDETYIKVILPQKMKWNLKAIKEFNICKDLMIMVLTVVKVIK